MSAETLNEHYARIFTDLSYSAPPRTCSACNRCNDVVSEWRMFTILDKLRATAAGLDKLPAWFLRLFSVQPWHDFSICLFPPALCHVSGNRLPSALCLRLQHPAVTLTSDQSITPVLSRVMERIVVTQFLYPALLVPPPSLDFNDQYVFRPTSSTTAALISLLHTVTDLLLNNPYVAVIALDSVSYTHLTLPTIYSV